MNGLTQNSDSLRSKKISQLHAQEISSHRGPKKHPVDQPSSVPLYFHCLGGNWDGQIRARESRSLELRIQGLPPLGVGQELKFQIIGTTGDASTEPQTGTIQHIHIQPGSSPWEGTTILTVALSDLQGFLNTSHGDRQDSFPLEQECFVISQVTQEEESYSCEKDPHADESRARDVLTNKPMQTKNSGKLHTPQHITSSRISFQNSSGSTIMAYHDYPRATNLSVLPVVVLAPGYGETKRDYLTLAYYFASNGFHVIRYDHTNHVGESNGTHFDSSLSSMKEDFQAVTKCVRRAWPLSPVIGVASSLASRVALKAESQESTLNLLILLVGVVDVQRSVSTVHQEDVFANFLNGQIQDSANILGFNVGSHFLDDALTNNFATLETTLVDVQKIETPIMYIAAGNDAWIDVQDQATFKQAINAQLSKWLDVPDSLHRVQENPKIARATYRQMIQHCHEDLGVYSLERDILEPNRTDLGRQNRHEKIASPQHSLAEVGHTFWTDYLGHFQTVGTCPDYVQLLDHVFHALGPITPGQQFLDAGCGNGNGGLYFLQSLQDTQKQLDYISENPIRYVGIDVVHEALIRAQSQMTQAHRQQKRSSTSGLPAVQMSWSQVDLQHALPFIDNQFDRIVSNLVLGYLSHPQDALRELFRVLAPGGRLVLTNLKPNGDFSGIYQNLVSHAGETDQKVEARNLLNNYGKIRQAEKEGQFRFFDQAEWMTCLDSIDGLYTGVYPTFANQAYLIVLEKPSASPHLSLLPQRETVPHAHSTGRGTSPFIQAA